MPDSPRRSQTSNSHNPVVASLAKKSPHPFSSIGLSPTRQYAVTASKDTLQIVKVGPFGITPQKTIPIAQHFQTAVGSDGRPVGHMGQIYEDVRDTFVRDSFRLGHRNPSSQPSTFTNVVITDVAWSIPQKDPSEQEYDTRDKATSLIAAAGSNGVIVVWNSDTLLGGGPGHPPAPEAVLSQHARAVNRLAWHPTRPGLLLSASQDGTVLLWERRKAARKQNPTQRRKDRFSFFAGTPTVPKVSYTWQCKTSFEPKSEAVRDIRWSPFYEDVFALVTTSGSLIAYNMNVKARALVKMTAHSGDATTLDWHPTRPYVVATGGAGDRCVKIWDLESYLNMNKDESNINANQNTWASRGESVGTEDSGEAESSSHSVTFGLPIPSASRTISSTSSSNITTSRHKGNPKAMLHVLSISASVTRLKWRPPANEKFVLEDEDRHDSMLAVATAPIKGASAGGSGLLALWSYNRPFMPLSIVEGHKVGAVTDFDWLDTPQPDQIERKQDKSSSAKRLASADARRSRNGQSLDEAFQSRKSPRAGNDAEVSYSEIKEMDDMEKPIGIWQHVLSVGRDGRCLLQSFARGDRPIAKVPPSCFAMADLSPFQRGYGSLQLFSVYQDIPTGTNSDFMLTGLRRDNVTARAPGVFRETPNESDSGELDPSLPAGLVGGERLPATTPQVVFNVVDQGDLDDDSKPIENDQKTIVVAPEVIHLSRLASLYVFYPDETYTSRVALCHRNGNVAQSLRCRPLAHMWRMVAFMLESAGNEGLPDDGTQPSNAMQFVIVPTIKSLLEERAEAGDVQTCVALCEVLQVLKPDQTTRIPGLEINLVREWYLSYIDLLRDMCLFSHATFLIRSCQDPYIAALNQQSTTIHESCPHCGKPLPSADGSGTARRVCKSCSRKIARCFLCHETVQGVYVWCPGCGHGGHLQHALQWFGGLNGKPVREVCPTGCGHKCNRLQQLSAFPRTESLRDVLQMDQIDALGHGGV